MTPDSQHDAELLDRPRMTLRVSRDSGRTFGRVKHVYARDCEPPELNGVYPPCECARCRGRGEAP
ncbi:hypothetical protein [Streptomyces sp. MAR4 CNX-425]|uniref:hypothetical protein n=1 Tax=Streptomyces sp. MAR4 CNX-425 TaxID=3406343 RepID=UPI003B509939